MNYPPFPDDVPTHPLLIVDYALLKAGDTDEIDKLWKAATEIGFWYLKNHGANEEVEKMFEMGQATMGLPLEEKMKYEVGDSGFSPGYKMAGSFATDEYGTPDTIEFLNVAKDDALAYPTVIHRTYPHTVNERMGLVVKPFVQKSLDVTMFMLELFEERLCLHRGALLQRHAMAELSGSEARCTRNPPKAPLTSLEMVGIGAHTDFGSLSFLHNRQGGLQVLTPHSDTWQYVRPLPDHAVLNIGDALALFSGGILRSNMHRVIPAPGAQSVFERWSLVFFLRPGNSIKLRALVEESPLVADEVSNSSHINFETGVTADEWFTRRNRNLRLNNRTGPETWHASRGTEHQPDKI